MLKIRLTRTGRTKQESFRIVVAEQARPVKGKFIEVIGHYQPSRQPKQFDVQKDRVEFWMKLGAQPSSTVAGLLKRHGMADMDRYIETRQSNIKKKGEEEVKADAPAAAKKEEAPAA